MCVCGKKKATAEFPMTALLTRSSLHELPESRPSTLTHPLITYSWPRPALQMSVRLSCDFRAFAAQTVRRGLQVCRPRKHQR